VPTAQRDLDDTRHRLIEWLSTKLPEATDLSLGPVGGPDTTGFSSDTLLVDARWADMGGARAEEFVIRVEPTGEVVFPHYDMDLQFRVLDALAPTDIPVPRVWWYERDPAVLGTPFFVMSRVDGHAADDNPPYTMEGWVMDAAPDERRTFWFDGLDVLAKIHNLDFRALGLADLAPTGSPWEAQLGAFDDYVTFAAPHGTPPLLVEAREWLVAHAPARDGELALCWGDARVGNMLFEDNHVSAVLDWEMVTVADPVMDLAWYCFFHRHFTETLGVESPEGFPTKPETVARWIERTGRNADAVDTYEVFAAYRFAAIMMRVAAGMEGAGTIEPGTDFAVNNTATVALRSLLDTF